MRKIVKESYGNFKEGSQWVTGWETRNDLDISGLAKMSPSTFYFHSRNMLCHTSCILNSVSSYVFLSLRQAPRKVATPIKKWVVFFPLSGCEALFHVVFVTHNLSKPLKAKLRRSDPNYNDTDEGRHLGVSQFSSSFCLSAIFLCVWEAHL